MEFNFIFPAAPAGLHRKRIRSACFLAKVSKRETGRCVKSKGKGRDAIAVRCQCGHRWASLWESADQSLVSWKIPLIHHGAIKNEETRMEIGTKEDIFPKASAV